MLLTGACAPSDCRGRDLDIASRFAGEEAIMGGVPAPLAYLLLCWGTVTAVLLVLVIYGNTLSIREDTELYLNKAMMAVEQKVLVAKMDRLKRVIVILAVFSGILLLVSAGVWVWIGFHS